MSGIIGHTMYAMLAVQTAEARGLAIASVLKRHWASYLAGSYLGCDIQTLPEAICVETGAEVGYGTVPLKESPLTGGPVRPWTLQFEGRRYTPRDIHRMFYGRSHLVFGWDAAERQLAVPWDHLPDYLSLVVEDAFTLFGAGERKLAYLFGWMTHIVGDSLIKSVRPGITLHLIDGKYTPSNRPVQDLVTFHEIGRGEFGIDWSHLLTDLAATPVEPVQLHYMRIGTPRGALARSFPDGWRPEREALLRKVLHENRRYQAVRNPRLLKLYALRRTGDGWKCDARLRAQSGGLSYSQMVQAAEKAHFRHALWQMGEAIAELFSQVVERQPRLRNWPVPRFPAWNELTDRWRTG